MTFITQQCLSDSRGYEELCVPFRIKAMAWCHQLMFLKLYPLYPSTHRQKMRCSGCDRLKMGCQVRAMPSERCDERIVTWRKVGFISQARLFHDALLKVHCLLAKDTAATAEIHKQLPRELQPAANDGQVNKRAFGVSIVS